MGLREEGVIRTWTSPDFPFPLQVIIYLNHLFKVSGEEARECLQGSIMFTFFSLLETEPLVFRQLGKDAWYC